MSFLSYIDIDPHIHLFALKKLNTEQTQQVIKERIHHLLKTRRFDELLNETRKLKDLTFPDLEQKLAEAKNQTEEQRKKLGSENLDKILADLEQEASKDDADFKIIDDGQLNIYKLAKIYYDQGQYQKSAEIIRKLQKQYLNETLDIKATWARLYCEILLQDPKVRKTVERLKKKIDEYEKKQKADRKKMSLNQSNQSIKQSFSRRKQFLNLITIAFFLQTKEQSYQKYVDYCSEQQNSAVIQLFCPYIVRYLCVSLILNKTLHKNRKFDLFNLVEALRRKIFKYTDPFVEFLTQLAIEYDFESARQKISDIKKCISQDVLLKPLLGRIVENSHFLYFKIYCKVFEKVKLSEIAQFVGKSEDEAQMWILGFIRSLDIEAKIDSVKREVVSSKQEENLNEKYVDLIPKMSSFINTLSQVTFIQN